MHRGCQAATQHLTRLDTSGKSATRGYHRSACDWPDITDPIEAGTSLELSRRTRDRERAHKIPGSPLRSDRGGRCENARYCDKATIKLPAIACAGCDFRPVVPVTW
jgi:hypothetical protein